MTTRKIKVWTGLGTYVLAGAGLALNTPASADGGLGEPRQALPLQFAEAPKANDKPHAHSAPAAPDQGGEGGERGATANASPDEVFLLRLLLMKGHLRVGRELVDQGRWNDALPHYLHPTEEIYKELAPALAERKIAPFDKELHALAAQVKARTEGGGVVRAQDGVVATLDAAVATLSAELRAKPAFVFAVAERLLDAAAAEYKEALEGADRNLRIANPVEYQDSRGFVWTAEELVQSLAPALKAKDAAGFASLEASFAALKQAWPSVVPGTGPVVPAAEVQANISRVALAMSRLR